MLIQINFEIKKGDGYYDKGEYSIVLDGDSKSIVIKAFEERFKDCKYIIIETIKLWGF